jgi:hypothetical protein
MTMRFPKLTALIVPLLAVSPGLRAQTAPATPLPTATASSPIKFSGWATASYIYNQPSPGTASDNFNVDSALLGAAITPSKDVTANVSLFYHPGEEGGVSPSGNQVTVLDAYVTFDTGTGLSIKAGKYLSPLGYESFYSIYDNMISLANQQFLAPIPGYHEGIEFDYSPDKTINMGLGVVDSLYQKPGYAATEGDGEFKHNAGFEGYVQYTGIPDLMLWGGFGYATKSQPGILTDGVVAPGGSAVTVLDFWASYQIDKTSTIAVEEIYKDGGMKNKGSNWLVYYQYNFTDKLSNWFAISGEKVSDGGPSYVKFSISPTYALRSNLSIRAQYSYTNYKKIATDHADFAGLELLFKF